MLKRLISLDTFAWSASFLNVGAMALQFRALVKTWDATGVSLGMLGIFCFVQVVYMMVGRRAKQWALFWGMVFSLLFTATDTGIVIYLRYLR